MRKIRIARGGFVHRWLPRLALALALLIAIRLPFTQDATTNYKWTLVFIWATATLGLTLLCGFSGQISVAQSVFVASGAYTSGVLASNYDWNYLATIPPAIAISFVLGILVGLPALRLAGLYLAMVTVAAAVITPPILNQLEFAGGHLGTIVTAPEAPSWSGLAQDQWLYFVALAAALLTAVAIRNLSRGRFGKALIALKDNETAAQTFGIPPARLKTLAFGVSAAAGGLAGSLYAFVVGIVAPESFGLFMAIGFLSAAVLGGVRSLAGAFIGAIFVRFMPDYAAEVNDALPDLIYGGTLILVMLVMPTGIVGLLAKLRDALISVEDPVERAPAAPPQANLPAAKTGQPAA